MKKKDSDNVQKLVDAQLVQAADLTEKDQELINSLGDEEINAIISAGSKVIQHAKAGENLFKVVF